MPIPAGFVTLTYRFIRAGDPENMVTQLSYAWDGSTPYQDIADDAAAAWVDSDMKGITTSETQLVGLQATFGTVGPGDLSVETSLFAQFGDGDPPALPNNCALLVRKLSALGGRKNRGRSFYPDVQGAATFSNGDIDPAVLGNFQSAWDDWMTNLDGVTGLEEAVILHSDPLDAPTPITSWVVAGKIATQRRRMRP